MWVANLFVKHLNKVLRCQVMQVGETVVVGVVVFVGGGGVSVVEWVVNQSVVSLCPVVVVVIWVIWLWWWWLLWWSLLSS